MTSNNYPKLLQYIEDKPSDDISEITSILDSFSFDPSMGCLICANSIKNGEKVYLNRKGEIYHQQCYISLCKADTHT